MCEGGGVVCCAEGEEVVKDGEYFSGKRVGVELGLSGGVRWEMVIVLVRIWFLRDLSGCRKEFEEGCRTDFKEWTYRTRKR